MKKHTRIGLMALITVVLMLALVVPVLAGGRGDSYFESCSITPPYWDQNGEVVRDRDFKIWGDFVFYTIEGGIVNECSGNVPLGDEINPQFTWLDFDEMCIETVGTCDQGVYYLDNTMYAGNNLVVDPTTRSEYWSPYYTFTLWDNGDFLFVKTHYFDE